MKQHYQTFPFKRRTLALIGVLNAVVNEYSEAGFMLTVRQLFYQLVSRALIENTEKSYKHICRTVNSAKLAGLIDWDSIEDRTRSFKTPARWNDPDQIIQSAAKSFHMDMWEDQDYRVCCIIEKEALASVFSPVCRQYDVPLLSARGYPSGSVLREFAKYQMVNQPSTEFVFLHFGDHDPSGIDMSRDLEDRLTLFAEGRTAIQFHRIALNIDQVHAYNPPPNPAKLTDSRVAKYIRLYGKQSWELDALDPRKLQELFTDEVVRFIDDAKWKARGELIEHHRKRLIAVKNLFFRGE